MGNGVRELRKWAERAHRLRAVPVDAEALAGIDSLLTSAAIRRMDSGVGPDGVPFKPLSKRYAQRKAKKRGHAKFWQWSGESKRKLRAGGQVVKRGIVTSIRWIINTPYSGAVHDGATIHVTRRSSSLATRGRFLKAMARRTNAHNKRLRTIYGQRGAGSTARARQMHVDALREGANARRRGAASLLPQYRRAQMVKRDPAMRGKVKLSWTIKIPARPVLGKSAKDEIGVGRILAASAKRRMEGGRG